MAAMYDMICCQRMHMYVCLLYQMGCEWSGVPIHSPTSLLDCVLFHAATSIVVDVPPPR